MAYMFHSLNKRKSIQKWKKERNEILVNNDDKIFIFIVIFSSIVITIDYVLIIKFIDMIKNI